MANKYSFVPKYKVGDFVTIKRSSRPLAMFVDNDGKHVKIIEVFANIVATPYRVTGCPMLLREDELIPTTLEEHFKITERNEEENKGAVVPFVANKASLPAVIANQNTSQPAKVIPYIDFMSLLEGKKIVSESTV